MNIERPFVAGTEEMTKFVLCLTDLPPSQAAISAALRRAFRAPADDASRDFEDLLRQLDCPA
jgi:hypothetical protein